MTTEGLFDVVFEGRSLSGVPFEKAVDTLAKISRKQPDDITHLFDERPKVLKRRVTKETALKYCKALRNAGLACHFIKAGSPLGTVKKAHTSGPDVNSASPPPARADYEAVGKKSVQQKITLHSSIEEKKKYRFHFSEPGCLVSLASLSFLLDQSLILQSEPADLPPATIGQRIWAAVSTFFHGIFLSYVLAFPLAFIVGLHLRFSDAEVTRSTIDAIRGGSALLGLVVAFFLMPLLWRGHSFGQRAMGILVDSSLDEDIDNLSGLAIMVRRLTFKIRSVCATPMSSSPWNKALIPFAAAVVLHLAMIPLAGAFMWMTDTSDNNSRHGSISSPFQQKATVNMVTRTQHLFHQLDPAMRAYIIESGMMPSPLTQQLFIRVVRQYLQPGTANKLIGQLNNGTLKLEGNLAEYRIGIFENDQWTILNERGEILQEKEF